MTKRSKKDRRKRERERRAAEMRRKQAAVAPERVPPKKRRLEKTAKASSHQQDELFEDMLPLFPKLDSVSDVSAAEQLMTPILMSDALADEPELDHIFIDPFLCAETLAQVGQEMGLDPESLSVLDEEEGEDARLDMLEEVARRVVTDEVRQEILDGLNSLRLRLKRSRKRKRVAQIAAVQSFLGMGGDGNDEAWPMIGLVQAIVARSIAVGFEMVEASMEIKDQVGGEDRGLAGLPQRLAESPLVKKFDKLLKKVPGLSGFLTKQADSIWKEGVNAIYEGKLSLELYSLEELAGGVDTLRTALGIDTINEAESEPIAASMSEEKGKAVVLAIDNYVGQLFTPDRLDQLRARIATVMDTGEYPGRWLSFLLMLQEHMAYEDAAENERGFLIKALIGEMRSIVEEDEEAEREA
ncbi:MAG: hypothetical protein JW918_05440 [Anaerolineae bacterium]|nr:hypothetical protein [Anaerolineae bacterium]